MTHPLMSSPGSCGRRAAEWFASVQQEREAQRARLGLERASGIHDEEILEGLRQLGIGPASLPVLDLVPLVLVGWADGAMSRLERDRIRAQAVMAGVDESHPGWPLLQHWMLERPSPEAERVLLDALSARLERLPFRARVRKRLAILRHCDGVARATGRLLGGPKVSREERAMLHLVDRRLGAVG